MAGGEQVYNSGRSAWCSVMTWKDGIGRGGRKVQEGVDTRIHIADSQCCIAETSIAL